MNSIARTFIVISLVVGIFSMIGVLIPDNFSPAIDGAIVYFLSALWALNPLIDVSVVLICFQILFNFIIGVSLFWVFHWFVHLTSGQ